MEIKYINTQEQLQKALLELAHYKQIALDLETYVAPEYEHERIKAVDPHKCNISLMCIQGRDTVPYVIDIMLLEQHKYYKKELQDFLATREDVLVFNGSFECKFIKKHIGVFLRNLYDLRVVQQLIGNATGSKFMFAASGYSLNDMLRDYLQMSIEGKDTIRIAGWGIRPPECSREWREMLDYISSDVKYLFDLYDITRPVIDTEKPSYCNKETWGLGYTELVDLEMEFVSVVAEMELNGLPFDIDLYNEYEQQMCNEQTRTGEIYNIAGEISNILGIPTQPGLLDIDYEIPTPEFEKSLNSPEKLKDLIAVFIGIQLNNVQSKLICRLIDLYTQITKTGKGSAELVNNEDELYGEINEIQSSQACENSALLKLVALYKKLYKQKSMKLNRFYNPKTGCIHPHYDSLKASTGRCSSSSPNAHQISGSVYVPVRVRFLRWFIK